MLNSITFYKALTYILIPIALFLGFIDTILLMAALLNPASLIYVFILACFVIYTFVSFKFFRQGVQNEQPLKKNLKDWIKVNAIVSFFLCCLFCLNGISILLSSNETLLKFVDEIIAQQPNLPKEITSATLLNILKGISVFFLLMGTVGLLHLKLTFSFLKQYSYLFEEA